MESFNAKLRGGLRYAAHLFSGEPARLAVLAAQRRFRPAPEQELLGTRFTVLAPPRSGSTLLVDLLNQHPSIEMAGEIFNRGALGEDMRAVASDGGPPVNLLARDLFPHAYLYDFWKRMRAVHPAAAIGYKHIYSQHPRMAREICADTGVRKLFVERRNYLKQYLSYLAARDTRTWASLDAVNECAAYVVSIPDLRVWRDDTVRQRDTFIAQVAETRQEHLVLAYEDFTDPTTQDVAMGRAMSFLGLPPLSVRPRLVKQNPYPARAMISNLPAVEDYLRGRGETWMLDAS